MKYLRPAKREPIRAVITWRAPSRRAGDIRAARHPLDHRHAGEVPAEAGPAAEVRHRADAAARIIGEGEIGFEAVEGRDLDGDGIGEAAVVAGDGFRRINAGQRRGRRRLRAGRCGPEHGEKEANQQAGAAHGLRLPKRRYRHKRNCRDRINRRSSGNFGLFDDISIGIAEIHVSAVFLRGIGKGDAQVEQAGIGGAWHSDIEQALGIEARCADHVEGGRIARCGRDIEARDCFDRRVVDDKGAVFPGISGGGEDRDRERNRGENKLHGKGSGFHCPYAMV